VNARSSASLGCSEIDLATRSRSDDERVLDILRFLQAQLSG
jgi:hypothetical protein